MKISIGANIQTGPWGGGNQFCHSLFAFLQKKNVDVSFDLKQNDLDLILLMEPRSALKISAYNHMDILRYQLYRSYKPIVIHRINGYYKQKGSDEINKTIKRANSLVDYSVYVSQWLQEVCAKSGLIPTHSKVILNGANTEIFNNLGYKPWEKNSPLRFVTHHWGGNYLKGFDIYERFDQLLSSPIYSNKFEFMYIGNLPKSVSFKHTKWIGPKYGLELASLIRSNHAYLTAALNEGGANHPTEGALCGLPILYRPSGSLAEYCQGYGIDFSTEIFEGKLNEMYDTYDEYVNRMESYPFTADRMCQQYYDLFIELLDHRKEIIERRKNQKTLALYFETLLPTKLFQKIIGKLRYWIS